MNDEINRERIALWVAGLRDPEAKQATKALTRADGSGDCCLGIACKVAIANGLELETETRQLNIDGGTVEVTAYGPLGEKAFLPRDVWLWFGFEDHDPMIGRLDGRLITGPNANDSLHLTLPEIADIVEEYFLTPAVPPVTV